MTLSQGAEIDPGVHADSDTHLRQAVTPSEARERGNPATQELFYVGHLGYIKTNSSHRGQVGPEKQTPRVLSRVWTPAVDLQFCVFNAKHPRMPGTYQVAGGEGRVQERWGQQNQEKGN